LITGFMKDGKSTFFYPLAISIAQGNEFLDYPTTKGNVLIVSVEEHERDVRKRLEMFGATSADPIWVYCGPLSNDTKTLKEIREFIEEKDISIMLIDTLSMFWNVRDENNNPEVIREIKPLLLLARETGVAVGLVHHSSKSGGENGRSIRGASSLFGAVDLALMLERPRGKGTNQRLIKTLGRYFEAPPELLIELQGNKFKCLGGGAGAWKSGQAERIVNVLTTDPKTVDEIIKLSGLSDKQVRSRLGELHSEHKVIKAGEGKKGNPSTYQKRPNSLPSL
jgi:predicted ATP-dependent serine protease